MSRFRKPLFGFFALSLLSAISIEDNAQLNHGGEPLSWNVESTVVIDWTEFEPLDLEAMRQEDDATATFKDAPWRFGIEQ
jgi:hypothetical protein